MNSRLFFIMFAILASGHPILADNVSVIKNASYKVCDGEKEPDPTRTCSGKQVTFYTYNGSPLKRVNIENYDCRETTKDYALDPSAPRP